jgi:WD40 repeat protein
MHRLPLTYLPRLFALLLAAAFFLLLGGLPLTATAAEPPTAPILRIAPGAHTAMIRRIASDAAGRWLVTASDDKTAQVWDLASNRLLATLRPPIGSGQEGKLNAVAMSPDGGTVAVGGWTGWDWEGQASIYLFDRASGRLLRRLTGLPNVINHLAFAPDGRSLAASLGGKNGIRLFDLVEGPGWGALLAEDRDYGDYSLSVSFSADGQRLISTSYDGFLRLYRWKRDNPAGPLVLLAKARAPGGTRPFAARFAPDGGRIAVGFDDTPAVNVLDSTRLRLLAEAETTGLNGDLSKIAWSRDGAWLYAAGQANKNGQLFIRRWAAPGGALAASKANNPDRLGAPQDWPVASSTIFDLLALPGSTPRLAFASGAPEWGVVDDTGRRELFHAPAVADLRANHEGFTLSADGAQVRFGYEAFGKSPAVFDSQQRSLQAGSAAARALEAAATPLHPPVTTAPGLDISGWEDSRTPRLNGQALALEQYEESRSLAIRPGPGGAFDRSSPGFILGTEWYLRAFDRNGQESWQQPVPGIVWGVNVSRDGRWVVAAYGDGTIRWHRATDGVEQLAFYPHPDQKRWVLWTPSGYFDASPGAEDLIGWHVNQGKDKEGRFVTGGQLYNALYRPDLIQRVVQGEDPNTFAQVDLEKLLASGDAPKVELLSPTAASAATPATHRDVTLKYRVCDAGGGIGQRVLRLNGITIALAEGNRGLKRKGGAQAQECLEEERLISLQPGENSLAVTAFNKTGQIESLPVELKLTLKGGLPAGRKPSLHVLALAIDKYRDGDLRLNYPKKDAEGLIAHLKSAGGKLFGEVKVHTLFDDTVRRGQIAEAFDTLAATVQPEDVFVLYLAGHGVTDRNDGNYYFLPVDFRYTDDQAVKKQALSNAYFQENLAKIRAGKSLVLLDTCNSGSFQAVKTRGVEEKTAMARLVKATGRATLMASSSAQVALEGYQGHGVFTWALIEGLKGKAASRDNQITVGSLADYVGDTLPDLTYKQFGYEQVPQRELQGMNFAIGVR